MKTKTQKILSSSLALVSLFAFSSCSNMDSAAKNDAGTGALLGGAAGAIIGHQSGRGLEGAALGAGLGGAAGYAVGNEKDKKARRYYY